MDVKKALLGLTLSLILSSGSVVFAADFDKGLEAYDSGDFKTALAQFSPLAEQGDASAQFKLGVMYNNGFGVRAVGLHSSGTPWRLSKAIIKLNLIWDGCTTKVRVF